MSGQHSPRRDDIQHKIDAVVARLSGREDRKGVCAHVMSGMERVGSAIREMSVKLASFQIDMLWLPASQAGAGLEMGEAPGLKHPKRPRGDGPLEWSRTAMDARDDKFDMRIFTFETDPSDPSGDKGAPILLLPDILSY